MSDLPAIALIEFSSIAAGAFAADAMVKKASIAVLRVGTVQPGKFLALVGGGTAEVELAHQAGLLAGSPQVLDEVFLPDVHEQVMAAVGGARRREEYEAFCVLETSTVAAVLRATDAAVKGAEVNLKEMRLADGLGGKGIAILTGERRDVEAAVEITMRVLEGRNVELCHSIVSRVDEALAGELDESTSFRDASDAPDRKSDGGGRVPATARVSETKRSPAAKKRQATKKPKPAKRTPSGRGGRAKKRTRGGAKRKK